MNRHISLSLLAILLLAACSGSVDVDKAAEELLEVDRLFASTSLEHGPAESFSRFLTADALSLGHGAQPLTGREKIVEGMEGKYTLAWDPQRAEVARSGELGWTWGTYVLTAPTTDSTNYVGHGKYLNIWRKGADNKWKVLVDMGNQNPDPNGESTSTE